MTDGNLKWKAGKSANKDRRVTLLRSAKTKANYKHGMGGLPKGDGHKPRPITLAPLPWDEPTQGTHFRRGSESG